MPDNMRKTKQFIYNKAGELVEITVSGNVAIFPFRKLADPEAEIRRQKLWTRDYFGEAMEAENGR